MKTILVASQKGGAGKTTIAKNLSVAASAEGAKVMMFDMDPQKSLREWYDQREADEPVMPGRDPGPKELKKAIDTTAIHGFDYLFIDTPPASDAWLSDAMKLADLVVIPVRPSPTDLRAVRATLTSAKSAGTDFVFFLSQTTRTKMTDEAVRALAARGKLADVNLALRVAHAETDMDGRSVIEGDDPKARDELLAAWAYVKEQL
ncbi:AAA family ATPase [Falsirhodobacter sp. 1013]|uniref:AAA family ATPase n=1 Tax=Falsirhodobacter sp. 1013 TaxID=3417566 RepID=UPI003EBF73BC